ncbi:hypothetical protein Ddye_008913 [Dipteronia dyeriana]|uniref:MULE transposase domain-containing protein n=1 Tax=Dipteronia dyeriana TaxID=168575 RepID=A0AAD9XAD4_9ROSI|nr:hypothetical protein Ddye_008913 [Dipteronia dyeriana]
MALEACVEGFNIVIRSVIAIDATHLKAKTRVVLLDAICKDGNEMIYLLSFGFANSQCTKSWTWFLKRLREVILYPKRVIIVSDRHVGICAGMEASFPDVKHGENENADILQTLLNLRNITIHSTCSLSALKPTINLQSSIGTPYFKSWSGSNHPFGSVPSPGITSTEKDHGTPASTNKHAKVNYTDDSETSDTEDISDTSNDEIVFRKFPNVLGKWKQVLEKPQ